MNQQPSPSAPAPRSAPADAEAQVPAVWQVGDTILDLYDVTGKLGEGGMGTVYKVHHRSWQVDLAVKCPKPALFAKAGGQTGFVREAETWVKLGLHPHIVTCYYVRTLGGIPRVFAEYVQGGSLSDWVQDRRLYSGGPHAALARILDIAIQFAWGLDYAHAQQLVHQDVKPSNVLMTPDGTAKVADFGLAGARVQAGEVEPPKGQQHALVSYRGRTPAYCSPEQAAGEGLSRQTDVWSWAVSLLDLFEGDLGGRYGPAAGAALAAYQAQGVTDPALPPMPSGVVRLLEQCFQDDLALRPATMQEVAATLQALYMDVVGQPYPRLAPKPAQAVADTHNNRALSFLDLGKDEEAEQEWAQALQVDPAHLLATYHRGVRRWRQAALTDVQLLRQMEHLPTTSQEYGEARTLLAAVHLERGDVKAARAALEEARQAAPTDPLVVELLGLVAQAPHDADTQPRTFAGHTQTVSSVCLSVDGRLALTGSVDMTLKLWEVESGHCLRTFTGHTRGVKSVCLSVDGRLALSGSIDKTLKLWEVDNGRCLRTLQGTPTQYAQSA